MRSAPETRLAAPRRWLRMIARPLLAFVAELRIVLAGHEELLAIVMWAAFIGVCGALASVAFREAIHAFQWASTGKSGGLVAVASELVGVRRVIVPVVGGLAAGLVLQFGEKVLVAKRSVDYMEAVVVGDGVIAARPTLVRSVSSLLSIGSGGSIGREGPMVQLAALIGSKAGLFSRAPLPRRRLFVACGAAAGIASAYNAPIAGALFVAEIVMGTFAMESFGPLLVASVSADATIHRFLGYGPVFEVPQIHFGENWELLLYALLGILLGHLSPPFLALLEWSKARFAALPVPLYAKLAIGGLLVGLASLWFPEVWGNGYSVVDSILHERLVGWLLCAILIAKLFSTAATVGSGAVGGVFTPTLFIGAAVGALIGSTLTLGLPHMASGAPAFAVVGMGAFLAATTHAPLTSVLMIFEMTLDHAIVLPLILACVTAHYTAKVYRGGASVYRDSLLPRAGDGALGEARMRSVADLIKPALLVVDQHASVGTMLQRVPRGAVRTVYVVNAEGELIASLDPRVIAADLRRGDVRPESPILDVSTPSKVALTPELGLAAALDLFLRENAKVLPAVAGPWRMTLLGDVARHDLLLALQDRMAGKQ